MTLLTTVKNMKFKPYLKRIRRNIFEVVGNSKYSRPGLFDLDKKLQKYLNFRNGLFIEVGANDGFNQSNTYYLEKFMGWTGILVEPIPELFQEAQLNRRKSSIFNCALVSNDFRESFVEMHYANLRSLVDGSYKNREREESHIKAGLETQNIKYSYDIKVQARTLESILDECKVSRKVDFLSLDVEGYELNVLQGLNLEKYGPTYILVEANHLNEVNSYLESRYVMLEKLTLHDYLYKSVL